MYTNIVEVATCQPSLPPSFLLSLPPSFSFSFPLSFPSSSPPSSSPPSFPPSLPPSLSYLAVGSPKPTVVHQKCGSIFLNDRVEPARDLIKAYTIMHTNTLHNHINAQQYIVTYYIMYTVKPLYSGHSVKQPPHDYSHLLRSLMM